MTKPDWAAAKVDEMRTKAGLARGYNPTRLQIFQALHEAERRGLEKALEIVMGYSDADGEVTEGRGIVAAIRALTEESNETRD